MGRTSVSTRYAIVRLVVVIVIVVVGALAVAHGMSYVTNSYSTC